MDEWMDGCYIHGEKRNVKDATNIKRKKQVILYVKMKPISCIWLQHIFTLSDHNRDPSVRPQCDSVPEHAVKMQQAGSSETWGCQPTLVNYQTNFSEEQSSRANGFILNKLNRFFSHCNQFPTTSYSCLSPFKSVKDIFLVYLHRAEPCESSAWSEKHMFRG